MAFDGKIALITGGTGALGRAVVRTFAEAGATVIVPYHREASFADLREELIEFGDRVQGRRADVTEEAEVIGLVNRALEQYGRIDYLFNLVGGYEGGKFLETDLSLWDRMYRLNTLSTLVCTHTVLPRMVDQGSGRIITIGARLALEPPTGSNAYAAAKAAVVSLTQSVAREIRTTGVTINCIVPSTIDTEANRRMMPKADPKRWVKPQAIADLIAFLCTDSGAAINGAVIPVYGQL